MAFSQPNPQSESVSYRTLPLTKGYSAILDAEDFERFGHLRWHAGAGLRGTPRYACRHSQQESGKRPMYYLHRLIIAAQPGEIVDHINGNTFDNRRANLRLVNSSQNAFNRRSAGLKGVAPTRHLGRWRGEVKRAGKTYTTKSFRCPILAAAARDLLAQRIHGEYAVLNFQFIPIKSLPQPSPEIPFIPQETDACQPYIQTA